MKTRIQNLTVALFVLAISTIVIAKPSSYSVNLSNQTSLNLGNVQVQLYGGTSAYQYVPAGGEYPVSVSVGPTGAVINSYYTAIGQVGYAMVSDGQHTYRVKVDFSSGSSIVVIDQQIVS